MRIGEVAAKTGVSVETVRYYERRGLLAKPARLASGYRSYGAEAVRTIHFVRQSRELGYTLAEIAKLLRARRRPGGNAVEVRAIAEARIRQLDGAIAKLTATREELSRLVRSCNCGDAATPSCPVIERLNHYEKT